MSARIAAGVVLAVFLAGCGRDDPPDLKAELQELARDLKPRIEPVPPVPVEETFVLDPSAIRDPFRPRTPPRADGAGRKPR